ncbi:hypothetical protein J5N97_029993 [Dioscorea zingiberensis]|uniref:Aminotransferase-like plant mobile domain-containing protein n=1 Tax=Dioscorea zingiberensis TaxID=325984 RepID=A0A9D5BWV8_9LILI|nr:hypothetical protein J5N97_029993 [Dioscorea zingiberensis]
MPHSEEFKKKLLLYIIGTIVRPTGNVHITTTYLSLLPNLDDIRNLNWAKYAFEGMLAAVRTYKSGKVKGVKNKHIGGCIWLLQHMAMGIIHQPLVDRQLPRVSHWTTTLITRVVKHITQRGGVGARTISVFTPLDGTTSHTGVPHREGQEESSLRTEFNALKRDFENLRTHGILTLTDIRQEVGDMVYGQLAAIRDATVDAMKKEFASMKNKMAEM